MDLQTECDLGRFMEEKRYKILAGCAILAIILLLPLWGECQEGVDHILNGIHNRYGGVGGLVINYRREVKTKTMSMLGGRVKGDLASGKIYLLPPNLLRVEQEKPRPETVLADGQALWWIIPEEKKVYQYSSDQFGQELRVLTDLWQAPSRLKNRFNIKVLSRPSDNDFLMELIPNPPWEQVDRIRLQITKKFTPQALDIINPIGTTTRFYFDAIKPAHCLSEKNFQFVVPEGYTVIHDPSQ